MAAKKSKRKGRSAALPQRSREERIEAGRALRAKLPRSAHAEWGPGKARRDPIDILERSNEGRIQDLVPIRYGRMLASPFAFLRGSAALMARDLAKTPSTGIDIQVCGDCHLSNFGVFATPERNLVFDINDFDESLPAPWEWDIKRLATSFVVAARENRLSKSDCRSGAVTCVRSYRKHLREYSRLSPLEVWYTRLDMQMIIDMAPNAKSRAIREQFAQKARERIIDHVFPKIVAQNGGRHRFVEQPPLIYRPKTDNGFKKRWMEGLELYRRSLPEERRHLFDRYRFEDLAMKVVGIGSVGTRCAIALFFSEEGHPLILQIKEANRSVLEPYTRKSGFENQGERVVVAQRLMQSSSDIFLGWTGGRHQFYIRQLRDMKFSVPVDGFTRVQLGRYAELCGWALARAHAKGGDAATISGYMGKADPFDEALGDFAVAYADQTERDHDALVQAERSGRIEAIVASD